MANPADTKTGGPRGGAGESRSTANTTYPAVEDLVTVDGVTIAGNGTTRDPIRAIGSGSGNPQVFRYTRQPGDTDTIVIALPAARLNVNYNVQVTQGEFTDTLACAAPPSLYLVNQFTLRLSSAPVAGDTFLFTVEDLT